MTTPASALSFHCMICFEEFHHADRYPVVLPCGHTYVCVICAQRLDKCMECRTPLTWSIPNPSAPRPNGTSSHQASNTRTGRWSTRSRTGGRGLNTQARGVAGGGEGPVMEKKRLPLPKNVVLLSLMEATELASEMEHTRTRIDSLLEQDIDDEEGIVNEEEKIKLSTSLTIGACGTYIVSEKEGLEVYPSRPPIALPDLENTYSQEKDMPGEDDVNSLVRFFHLDHKLEVRITESEGNLKAMSSEESALLELRYGDRVQIVSFDDDGWAKLARGYGYIRANPRQLVKVGGSVDRACRIEAYLHALAARRRELKTESGKIDTRFTGLMNNLQDSLFNDEDLTVIAADTFENDSAMKSAMMIPQQEEAFVSDIGQTYSEDSALQKPHMLARQPTPPMASGLASCSMGSVFHAMTATLGGDEEVSSLSSIAPTSSADCLGLGPVLQEDHAQQRSIEQREEEVHPQARRSPPRTRELSAEAEAWRERYYQNNQRSRGVDFRTGFSGHQGLVNYMVHPHAYLDHQRVLPKMSSHSGLSRAIRPSKSSGGYPSPTYSHSHSRELDH